jgi:hypothetical protein
MVNLTMFKVNWLVFTSNARNWLFLSRGWLKLRLKYPSTSPLRVAGPADHKDEAFASAGESSALAVGQMLKTSGTTSRIPFHKLRTAISSLLKRSSRDGAGGTTEFACQCKVKLALLAN